MPLVQDFMTRFPLEQQKKTDQLFTSTVTITYGDKPISHQTHRNGLEIIFRDLKYLTQHLLISAA